MLKRIFSFPSLCILLVIGLLIGVSWCKLRGPALVAEDGGIPFYRLVKLNVETGQPPVTIWIHQAIGPAGNESDGFRIFVNPKDIQDDGPHQADATVGYYFEREYGSIKTERLIYGFDSDFSDFTKCFILDKGRLSKNITQAVCIMTEIDLLGPPQRLVCANVPNNRQESTHIMNLSGQGLNEFVRNEKISAKIVRELMSGGKITKQYWEEKNQAERESLYAKSHPDYRPQGMQPQDVETWFTKNGVVKIPGIPTPEQLQQMAQDGSKQINPIFPKQ